MAKSKLTPEDKKLVFETQVKIEVKKMSEEELMDLSRDIMKDLFAETTYDLETNFTSKATGDETIETFDEHLVLGGFFAAPGSDVFIQGKNDTVAVKRVSMSNDFFIAFYDVFSWIICISD